MERRRAERFPIVVEVRVENHEFGAFLVNTRDLSDSGVFLQYGDSSCRPVLGAAVLLQLSQMADGGEPPLVRGRVVRITDDGFAVEFEGLSG